MVPCSCFGCHIPGCYKDCKYQCFFCHFVDWPSFPYLLTFTCLCDMQCNFSVVGPLLTEADKQCVDFVDSAQNELASQRLQFCVQCILHQFLVAPNRANVSLDACLWYIVTTKCCCWLDMLEVLHNYRLRKKLHKNWCLEAHKDSILQGNINIYEIYADVCVSAQAQAETRHFGKQVSTGLSYLSLLMMTI